MKQVIKKIIPLILVAAVLLLLAVTLLAVGRDLKEERLQKSSVPVQVDEPEATLSVGDKVVVLEVAGSDRERTLGLSKREPLPLGMGMLFVFDENKRHGIWMKDMRFSIDIIWLDAEFRVVDIQENVSPETFPTVFRPRVPARYVIEGSAGFAREHQIEMGEILSISL